ncbi:T7SS effector LXG polymorphic toxin [Streptococcus sp. H49]|uniref:T7SS effector LXG polymorphic toxin n=1 Tax=Streptococcus huangxiaojuni TaxID=3237239 RepID=UPI0034A48601
MTSATAIIDTDYLQGLEDGYSTIESSIATIDSETSKIYSSISDIISLTNPSSSDITTPLSEAKKVLTDTKSNMETFNGWTLGKVAQVGGWTMVAMEAGVYGYQGYTDEDSRTYHSVGKSAIHAGVETIKNAGPLEATAALAKFGSAGGPIGMAVGAAVGFAAGTFNAAWGAIDPESKDKAYSWVENKAFDAYDGAAKAVKDVGRTVSDKAKSVGQSLSQGWNNVTSAFGF